MPMGVAAGLSQGLASGIAQGVQLKVLQDIQGARKEFFESESKINKARATQVETRQKLMQALGIGQLLAGDQGEAITEQNIPGTAPLGENEQIGAFPPTSQAGEQDTMRQLLAAGAINEGQFGQALNLLQPSQPKATIIEFGNELLAITQDPQTGTIRSHMIAQQEQPGDIISLGVHGNQAVLFDKNARQVLVQTIPGLADTEAPELTKFDTDMLAAAMQVPGAQLLLQSFQQQNNRMPTAGEMGRLLPPDVFAEVRNALRGVEKSEKLEISKATGEEAAKIKARGEFELGKLANETKTYRKLAVDESGRVVAEPADLDLTVEQAVKRGNVGFNTSQEKDLQKATAVQDAIQILDDMAVLSKEILKANPGFEVIGQGLDLTFKGFKKTGQPTNIMGPDGRRLTDGEVFRLLEAKKQQLAPTLGRAVGQAGAFAVQEIEQQIQGLGGRFDTGQLAETKFNSFREFLTRRVEREFRRLFGSKRVPKEIGTALRTKRPTVEVAEIPTLGSTLETFPKRDQDLVKNSLQAFFSGQLSVEALRSVLVQTFGQEQGELILEEAQRLALETEGALELGR